MSNSKYLFSLTLFPIVVRLVGRQTVKLECELYELKCSLIHIDSSKLRKMINIQNETHESILRLQPYADYILYYTIQTIISIK